MEPTWTRTAPPAERPVTLDEAKLSLRLSGTALDSEILAAIDAATETLEHRLDRAFCSQSFQWVASRFPNAREPIQLAQHPIASVTSINYTDPDGGSQLMDPAEYALNAGNRQIYRANTENWPATDKYQESVKIVYVAGYASRADVPWIFKRLITQIAGRLFYDPAMERTDTSRFIEDLITQYVRTGYT